jgi:hypothetical protein
MISAKEAYNISFVNDECNEYLDEIEREILEEAKAGNYNVSIKLAARGFDIHEDESRKITIAIIGYLSNAGYNVSIDSGDNRASLKIDLSNAKYLKED